MSYKKIWEKLISINQVPLIAKKTQESIGDKNFCLWLKGDLGSGKTTFTKYFLYELGLNKEENVASPTFNIMFEYLIDKKWYAHLDFYRMLDGFSLEEENLLDSKDYQGIIIEWANRCRLSSAITATHILEIKHQENQEDKRKYFFYALKEKQEDRS